MLLTTWTCVFGKEYLHRLVINKSLNYLKQTLPYLQELGVLHIVPNSASILTLKLDEIMERKRYIESHGFDIVVDGKFNYIFGLSRKRYQNLIAKNKKK